MTIVYKGTSTTFDMLGWYCEGAGENIDRPDYAHVFGSPGIGVNSLDELNLEGKTIITVTSNPGDRVVTIGPFGSMPPEHAISYPAMGNPPQKTVRQPKIMNPMSTNLIRASSLISSPVNESQ